MVSIVTLSKKVLLTIAFALSVQGAAIPADDGQKTPDFEVTHHTGHKHGNFTHGPYYLVEHNSKRDGYINVQLYNEDVSYSADITVGSNNQQQNVIIDTGSSDLWVVDSSATCQAQSGEPSDYCKGSGTYSPGSSTSVQKLGTAFNIAYGDGSSSKGTWVKDTVGISGVKITGQQLGDVTSTSVEQGILGIGLNTNEASSSVYDNVPITLKKQGYISTNAYSLYLNSPSATSGTLILGGIDNDKYSGSLVTLPLTSSTELRITTNSVTVGSKTVNINAGLLLDSGTTLTYLQSSVVSSIASAIGNGISYDSSIGAYIWSCNQSGSLTYNFPQGLKITVPYSDLTVPLYYSDGTVADQCAFGILPDSANILGDNFLRHAYIAYNLDAKTVGLAPVVYTSSSSITTF
ncbi:SAP8 Candidapepsin-8 [Candida maltosa Xu316]